jgi:hypothetical protein
VVTVSAGSTSTYVSIPAKFEAEASTMYGVQTETTLDAGGGLDVGWIDNGDWMDYNVNVPSAGTYSINFRVASPYGAQFQVRNSSGAVVATVGVPNTGAFQSWQTVNLSLVLPSGNQTLRIVATQPSWNLNWVDFALTSTPPPPPPPVSGTIKVEAEAYTSMNGIQTENTQDAGAGLDVGWMDVGDWMNYSVSPTSAGTYAVNLRVASPYGAQLQIRKTDGTILATVAVPNTGAFQAWQTVNTSITLAAGTQTLRIYATQPSWNLNWFDLTAASGTPPPPPPPPPTSTTTKVEAEAYSSMSGVKTENTQDAGGGLDVGWIDNGDWMDYSITTAAAGSYTANFRIASLYWGGQFQVKSSSGAVLATVSVPNTGGYQNWQTISVPLTLASGTQTLRILATVQPWNINWFEIVSASSGTTAKSTEAAQLEPATSITIFPNPVQDRFVLKVNNELTGQMKVQITDMSGTVKKTFTLDKPQAGSTQSYLSVSDLVAGDYLLTVQMDSWTASEKISKQ